MYEELLEDIAQTNGLREVNTYVKLVAGLGAILLCLLSTSFIAPLFIGVLLSGAIILLARVDARTYAKLFVVPFWFAAMSVIVIILLSGGSEVYWSLEPAFMAVCIRYHVKASTRVFLYSAGSSGGCRH